MKEEVERKKETPNDKGHRRNRIKGTNKWRMDIKKEFLWKSLVYYKTPKWNTWKPKKN